MTPRSSVGVSSELRLREEIAAHARHAERDEEDRDSGRGSRSAEHAAIATLEPSEAAFDDARDEIRPVIVLEEFRAHHRRQRQRDEARDDHGAGERQREFEEQPSGRARREGDRRIDGGERQRHRDDGEADLAHALDRRVERLHAVLDVAEDVFEHHDGVVDDEADGEHHGEQRQRVDRQPGRAASARRR